MHSRVALRRWLRRREARWGIGLFLVWLVVVVLLHVVRIPTRVDIALRTTEVQFSLAGESPVEILAGLGASTVGIQSFADVTLRLDKIAGLPLTRGNGPTSRRSRATSRDRAVDPVRSIQIVPRGSRSFSTCILTDRAGTGQTPGFAVTMAAPTGARVALGMAGSDQREVSVHVVAGEDEASCEMYASGWFSATVRECRIIERGHEFAVVAPEITFRGRLADSSDLVKVEGNRGLLFVSVVVPEPKTGVVLADRVRISSIALTDPYLPGGEPVSTLLGEAEVSYPDCPGIARVVIPRPGLIVLDGLQDFWINQVLVGPDAEGLELSVSGVAGGIATSLPPGSHKRDLRLSLYERYMSSMWLQVAMHLPGLLGVLSALLGISQALKGGG